VRLLVCFPPPDVPEAQVGAPFGVKLVAAVLTLRGTLAPPTAVGRYIWSGLFTPYVRGTGTLGPAVEARAIVPVPNRLTLRARLVGPRRNVAVISGQLTQARAHPARVRVELHSVSTANLGVKLARVATVRTRRGGRFTFRRRVVGRVSYFAFLPARAAACSGSTAPGGCVGALIASAQSRVIRVGPRRR
jgi:hypothetical protein